MTNQRDVTALPFECPRCGSDEWSYCDYGGCSDCRSHDERAEEAKVDSWVAWALTTPLRHGITTFGRLA